MLDELRDASAAYFSWVPTTTPPDWASDIKPLEERVHAARTSLEDYFRTLQRENERLKEQVIIGADALGRNGEAIFDLQAQRSALLSDNERLRSDAERWRFVAPLLADQLHADGEMMLKIGIHDFHTGSVGDYSDKLVIAAIDTARLTDAAREQSRRSLSDETPK